MFCAETQTAMAARTTSLGNMVMVMGVVVVVVAVVVDEKVVDAGFWNSDYAGVPIDHKHRRVEWTGCSLVRY